MSDDFSSASGGVKYFTMEIGFAGDYYPKSFDMNLKYDPTLFETARSSNGAASTSISAVVRRSRR